MCYWVFPPQAGGTMSRFSRMATSGVLAARWIGLLVSEAQPHTPAALMDLTFRWFLLSSHCPNVRLNAGFMKFPVRETPP